MIDKINNQGDGTSVVKIRINTKIIEKLKKIANDEGRTFAGQVRYILNNWINSFGCGGIRVFLQDKEARPAPRQYGPKRSL